ncbi:prepilin-type N-terminal cleavage/methylation domain-containing protein [Kiritimatiellota bacterium B12222]|nr:prepilin-type N-terminal cleavage/methylation domain-containing protein [Kiritimatiellota bacterium B12222]
MKHQHRSRITPPLRSPREAFTLIEMLVVIAIIVVLISFIVPTVTQSLNRATRTKCLSNLRQISITTLAWATDHQGELPVVERESPLFPHAFENYEELFEDTLGPRDQAMFCPGKLRKVRNPQTNQYDTIYTTYQYFNIPIPFSGSYSTNKPDLTNVSSYPHNAAVWGCLTLTNGAGISLAHDEPGVSKPVSGMNAVFIDGHGGWVEFENLEVYYSFSGAKYYWPNPES